MRTCTEYCRRGRRVRGMIPEWLGRGEERMGAGTCERATLLAYGMGEADWDLLASRAGHSQGTSCAGEEAVGGRSGDGGPLSG